MFFHGKGQVMEIIFPRFCKLGFFSRKKKKVFYIHTGSLFQRWRNSKFPDSRGFRNNRAVHRINTDMFDRAAVHRTSLMNLVVCDDSASEITIQ